MGIWDWLDDQYPASGLDGAANGFSPYDSPLQQLLTRAAMRRQPDDDPSATQPERQAPAVGLNGVVQQPNRRDDGVLRQWSTQAPEEFARLAWPYLTTLPPKRPYPANIVTPVVAPVSPASVETDDARAAQAAREAAALRSKEAVKPDRGQRNEGELTQWVVDHWPEFLMLPFMAPEAAMLRAAGGAARAATGGVRGAMEDYNLLGGADGSIFRSDGTNPSNLTPRPKDNGVLSFRDSLSNPYPLRPGQRPVLAPGREYGQFDSSKLPPGSVIRDNNPPGHVGVRGVSVEELIKALIGKGRFRK